MGSAGATATEPADAPVEAAGCRRGRRPHTGGQRDPVPGPWTVQGAPARLLRRPTRPSGRRACPPPLSHTSDVTTRSRAGLHPGRQSPWPECASPRQGGPGTALPPSPTPHPALLVTSLGSPPPLSRGGTHPSLPAVSRSSRHAPPRWPWGCPHSASSVCAPPPREAPLFGLDDHHRQAQRGVSPQARGTPAHGAGKHPNGPARCNHRPPSPGQPSSTSTPTAPRPASTGRPSTSSRPLRATSTRPAKHPTGTPPPPRPSAKPCAAPSSPPCPATPTHPGKSPPPPPPHTPPTDTQHPRDPPRDERE